MSKKTGRFLTYDAAAIRLWTARKQIKSLRLDAKYNDLTFLSMSSVDELDAVLLWLTPKKSAITSSGARGVVMVVSFDLVIQQEVALPL